MVEDALEVVGFVLLKAWKGFQQDKILFSVKERTKVRNIKMKTINNQQLISIINMESTVEVKETKECLQAKDSVRNMMGRYLAFVTFCLYDEEYVDTMENLLPLDSFARAKLKVRGEASVNSLGLSVMRMDFEPSVFSLGISIEMAEGEINSELDTTILVSAYRTLEQLRDYVLTENFEKVVRDNFEKQIDISFAQSRDCN